MFRWNKILSVSSLTVFNRYVSKYKHCFEKIIKSRSITSFNRLSNNNNTVLRRSNKVIHKNKIRCKNALWNKN